MKTEREQPIDWIDLYSVKNGQEFTLASGQKSSVYVDIKKTAMHHHGCKLLAKLLFEKMIEKFSPIDAVAGVVLGGCHLASIVAMHHPLDIDVIYVRKEVKDHGTQKLVERPDGMWLARTVILEDVVTTGNSAVEAARLLQKEKLDVVGILAVVDRRSDKKSHLAGEFLFVSLVDYEELHP